MTEVGNNRDKATAFREQDSWEPAARRFRPIENTEPDLVMVETQSGDDHTGLGRRIGGYGEISGSESVRIPALE